MPCLAKNLINRDKLVNQDYKMGTLPRTHVEHVQTHSGFIAIIARVIHAITHWWTIYIVNMISTGNSIKLQRNQFILVRYISPKHHQFRKENMRIRGRMHDFYPACVPGDIQDPSSESDPQRGSPGIRGHRLGC